MIDRFTLRCESGHTMAVCYYYNADALRMIAAIPLSLRKINAPPYCIKCGKPWHGPSTRYEKAVASRWAEIDLNNPPHDLDVDSINLVIGVHTADRVQWYPFHVRNLGTPQNFRAN